MNGSEQNKTIAPAIGRNPHLEVVRLVFASAEFMSIEEQENVIACNH
jgi:hypothetical protein